MRLPITIYKSSILASIVGTLGSIFMICGPIVMLEESFSEGLIPMTIGLVFCIFAYWLGKRAEFRKWLKKLKKSGELNDISTSTESALKLYALNPCKRTLKYIKSKNKTAADYITAMNNSLKQEMKNNKKTEK